MPKGWLAPQVDLRAKHSQNQLGLQSFVQLDKWDHTKHKSHGKISTTPKINTRFYAFIHDSLLGLLLRISTKSIVKWHN